MIELTQDRMLEGGTRVGILDDVRLEEFRPDNSAHGE